MTSYSPQSKGRKSQQAPRTKSYDPIDVAVGQRLKSRRTAIGMSQGQLAKYLDVTFQQVQKYERGENRIAASTLYRAGRALSVRVAHFFEGWDEPDVEPQGRILNHFFYLQASTLMQIENEQVRAAILALVQVLAAQKNHER